MTTRRDCQFECERCGIVAAVPCHLPVIHGCHGDRAKRYQPKRPGWRSRATRLLRFAWELAKHGATFCERRTPWEIAAIHRICRGCPHYRPAPDAPRPRWWQRLFRIIPAMGSCAICGCNLDSRVQKWLNAIAWRSKHCPANPPRW
jgi:hypothetical protein